MKLLAFNTNLDVLAISETHLSPALKDHEIAIQGYQVLRRDRIEVFDELRLWSLRSKLSIHPIKTEAMIVTKQGFIGPAPPPPPILFGDKYVNVVDHTTCLGLTIDNCLSWSKHI